MFNFDVSKQGGFFGGYHKMAHIWATVQGFDQFFKIRTVQTRN